MNDNNVLNNYDVMNGNNAMNGNYGMNVEQVAELVDNPQTIETMEAKYENDVQEQETAQKVVVGGPFPWFKGEDVDELRSRWNSIQTKFVDEPRTSVEQADALVADTLHRIETMFSEKRAILENKWVKQADISTEDLRTALQDYRSFFKRLLEL
jgi:hypothetical protein